MKIPKRAKNHKSAKPVSNRARRSAASFSGPTEIELNQQLIQSEKMASLGTIAAGVAHEINNPLGFLLSNVESLEVYMKSFRDLIDRYEELAQAVKRQAPRPEVLQLISMIEGERRRSDLAFILEDYQTLLKESLEGVHRIRDIVQSLHTFSRPYEEEPRQVDLNDCITAALRLVSSELKYKCVLQKEFGPVGSIYCNPGHLLQVFMNILLNAAQAIGERGTIKVRTYRENGWAFATIADNGCGIPDGLKAKIFTPFFTTKPAGQGTGLGLSVSYGIIKDLGGQIEVESQEGRGSLFRIGIPCKGGSE